MSDRYWQRVLPVTAPTPERQTQILQTPERCKNCDTVIYSLPCAHCTPPAPTQPSALDELEEGLGILREYVEQLRMGSVILTGHSDAMKGMISTAIGLVRRAQEHHEKVQGALELKCRELSELRAPRGK